MSKNNIVNKGVTYYVLHVVFWLTFFMFPFFIAFINNMEMDMNRYVRMLPDMLLCPIVFYLNYLYLIDKFLFHKHVWLYLLINLILLSVCVIFMTVTHKYLHICPKVPVELGAITVKPPHTHRILKVILHQGTSLVFFIAISVAIRMTYNAYIKDVKIRTYEMEKKEAELSNLKHQLNPHFLFNSLNTIYALAAIDGEKTQNATHLLSDMLRYMLYESDKDYAPLSKEIDFIKSYTELMKIRFQGVVDIKEEYCSDCGGIEVAPLIFITFVENAFKHGIDSNEDSFINIKIGVNGRDIICHVENSNHPKPSNDKSGSGIGLENVKKRLNFLYRDKYIFNTMIKEGMYITDLKIST